MFCNYLKFSPFQMLIDFRRPYGEALWKRLVAIQSHHKLAQQSNHILQKQKHIFTYNLMVFMFYCNTNVMIWFVVRGGQVRQRQDIIMHDNRQQPHAAGLLEVPVLRLLTHLVYVDITFFWPLFIVNTEHEIWILFYRRRFVRHRDKIK